MLHAEDLGHQERNIGTGVIQNQYIRQTKIHLPTFQQVLVYVATSCLYIRSKTNGIPAALWITILLAPTVPAAFAVNYSKQSSEINFAINFVAVIPLSSMLTLITDLLVARQGGRRALFLLTITGYAPTVDSSRTYPDTNGWQKHSSISLEYTDPYPRPN